MDEAILTRIERTLAEQGQQVAKLETNIINLSGDLLALTAQVERHGKPNWPLYTILATVMIAGLSALPPVIGYVMDSSIERGIAPLRATLAEIAASEREHDKQIVALSGTLSETQRDIAAMQVKAGTERTDLTRHESEIAALGQRMTDAVIEREDASARTSAAFVEVRARLAENARLIAVLWQRIMRSVLPSASDPPAEQTAR